jgi:hypothetical protein
MNTSGGDAMKTSIIYVCGAGLKKKKKKKKKTKKMEEFYQSLT